MEIETTQSFPSAVGKTLLFPTLFYSLCVSLLLAEHITSDTFGHQVCGGFSSQQLILCDTSWVL